MFYFFFRSSFLSLTSVYILTAGVQDYCCAWSHPRIPSSQILVPDNTPHSLEIDIHLHGVIRTRNSNKRAAADPHCKPRCHRDRRVFSIQHNFVRKNIPTFCIELLANPVPQLFSTVLSCSIKLQYLCWGNLYLFLSKLRSYSLSHRPMF